MLFISIDVLTYFVCYYYKFLDELSWLLLLLFCFVNYWKDTDISFWGSITLEILKIIALCSTILNDFRPVFITINYTYLTFVHILFFITEYVLTLSIQYSAPTHLHILNLFISVQILTVFYFFFIFKPWISIFNYELWLFSVNKKKPIIQKVNESIIQKQNGCPRFKAYTVVINYVRASLYFSFQCISFNAYN